MLSRNDVPQNQLDGESSMGEDLRHAVAIFETSGIAAAFRRRTRSLHVRAEKSGVVSDLLKGRASAQGYGLLLANLLPVYRNMEIALDAMGSVPAFAPLANRAVYRADTIQRDLETLFGLSWADRLPVLSAGERYAQRIPDAATGGGFRLIAHAYVRYLGDLNGGQVLKNLVGRAFGFDPGGLSFFDFPQISDLPGFRLSYRDALDRAGAELASVEPVIEEAGVAFQLNIELSESIRSFCEQEPSPFSVSAS